MKPNGSKVLSQSPSDNPKAVFFDRDGTLIVDKVYLNDPDLIEYLPGVFEALRALRDAGFVFFVVTNQSGVPRGLVQPKNLMEIHRRMRAAFAEQGVDFIEFYYAPYHTDHDHPYRKPNPGMLLQAVQEYRINLGRSWMVGDRMTDVEAGHRAGTRTVLVNSSENPEGSGYASPDLVCRTIVEVADFILKQEGSN
jgi:D-glycero-D-manno-heptose 1,7-bisphosphate phosphatase